jgi:4-hydroxy-2-oxoheptanedioate aldolase
MISTVDDAASFVSSCRYPPRGQRSFGPARALLYAGADYYPQADQEMLTLGMIETQAGLDNLDKILALEGLDGIYIGPNDLALALGSVPKSESEDPVVVQAVAHIRERAIAHGKIAGIFCSSGEAAAMRISQGFQMVTPGNEAALMAAAAKAAVATARGAKAPTASKTGY